MLQITLIVSCLLPLIASNDIPRTELDLEELRKVQYGLEIHTTPVPENGVSMGYKPIWKTADLCIQTFLLAYNLIVVMQSSPSLPNFSYDLMESIESNI